MKPVRYRRGDEDATLWSSGKDGTDENGKPPAPDVSYGDHRVKMDDVVRFEAAPD